MLPDIRAVIAAIIAALGLLLIAFGAVAMFRVAQDGHGALQADLAKRGRSAAPPAPQGTVPVVETPGPPIAPFPPLPVVEANETPVGEIRDAAPVAQAVPDPPANPPAPRADTTPAAAPAIGGPLEPRPETARAAERARNAAAARKARVARFARERKAAEKRAAQARARRPPQSSRFGNFGFGGAARQ